MTSQTLHHLTRELDHRHSDGIDVRLLWRQHDNRVLVAVSDSKAGDSFAIEVRDGERAFDVFHHPFAYAESRRLGTVGTPDQIAA